MRSVLPVNVADFHLAVKAKANASFRHIARPAAILRVAAAVATGGRWISFAGRLQKV
jgi:hypothetical protein